MSDMWVSEFREGNRTLGQVVSSVFAKRDAHWEAPPMMYATPETPKPALVGNKERGHRVAQRQQPLQQQLVLPPPPPPQPYNDDKGANRSAELTPGITVTHLRDGKKLCPDFQKGTCKVKKASCPLGLHKCGMVTKRGRVCGMGFHVANVCRQH